MTPSISVLGAGSWGTALAMQAARNGCRTMLWGHNSEHMASLAKNRENIRYLPGLALPESLSITDNLADALKFSSIILISVPSHAFRDTLKNIKPYTDEQTKIAWATKGFNPSDGALLDQVVKQVFSTKIQTAALSGPTFANEVAKGLPTALTIASTTPQFSEQITTIFHNHRFRTYTSNDITGVQVGGAVKNALAIAAGIADGLGFGANTRSALITRGLQEIMRLGITLGGQADTFMGLAGLGDLILTCTDNQSRNRRLGLALGEGKDKDTAIKEIGQEVEGISAAKETYLLSVKHNIEMPIIEQIYKVLYQDLDPRIAVQNLLNREQKAES